MFNKKSIKSHITNNALLSYPADWFPIRQDGTWANRDEFIRLKMDEYGLRTGSLVTKALATVGY